jgi:cytochrome c biogenesis protein CcmG/thiol:disulfide interchange protein DsbE
MKQRIRQVLIFLIIFLIPVIISACTVKEEEERKPAADFSIPDLEGKLVSLSDYKGQVVMINFWATWCTPCREEIPGFVELQTKYGPEGFTILGLTIDTIDPEEVKEFAIEFKMNYPVLYLGKQKKQVMKDYFNFRGIPTSFLIDRDGLIIRKVTGLMEKSFWDKEIRTALKEKENSQDQ